MTIDILTANSVALWKQERIVFRGLNNGQEFSAGNTVTFWTNLHGSGAHPIATYRCDADGNVYIDVTDYVRTYSAGLTDIWFSGNGFESPKHIEAYVVGLINPAKALIPAHECSNAAYIIPPHKFISANGFSHVLAFELRPTASSPTWTVKEYDDSGTLYDTTTTTGGSFALDDTVTSKIELTAGVNDMTRVLQPMLCDREYALVQWVSFTGVTRRHVWEVVKHTIAPTDVTAFLTLDDNYREIKGRTDGLTLRLDGLDAYDFWYYADLITSGNVQISLDGGTTYERVQVTGKSTTIPDGNAINGKLEITLNWRHYDAVNM